MDRFDGGRFHIQGPSGDSGGSRSFPGGATQEAHFLLLLGFLAVKCGIPDFPDVTVYISLLQTLHPQESSFGDFSTAKSPLSSSFPQH